MKYLLPFLFLCGCSHEPLNCTTLTFKEHECNKDYPIFFDGVCWKRLPEKTNMEPFKVGVKKSQ